MKLYYNYYLRKDKYVFLKGYGESNIDTIMISNINNKCSEYGISFSDFMEELINRLTMKEIEEILLSMTM